MDEELLLALDKLTGLFHERMNIPESREYSAVKAIFLNWE